MTTTAPRVLLVSMPWGAVDRPALGISLLKAGLERRGIACDVRYLNLDFAALLGLDAYRWIHGSLPHVAFAGDWVFAEALHGPRPGDDAAYLTEVLGRRWQVDAAALARLLAVRCRVEPFVAHCLAAIDWGAYDLVGFTSTFEQNVASLALAQRVKARWPMTRTVFGGANWEGEMGAELHRCFGFVDLVCSGEADESFPALVEAVRAGADASRLAGIGGLVWRDAAGQTVVNGPANPITRMDDLPTPDFADYFRALESSGTACDIAPTLLFETSRGCWWGAKSHCTFCGLNGGSMAFRSKSGGRALDELTELVRRWPSSFVSVVDNILDMAYFRDFLPALAEARLPVELFWEVKANLDEAQVAALAAAGVRRIQPGIESLNDRILRAMRKGTSALRNIQLLKWCRRHAVTVDWNVLHGFPGETRDDYERMRALLPAIRFLGPPGAHGPIRLDRFSPYFMTPEKFGIASMQPVAAYFHLYPFAAASVARIAYYFDFTYAAGHDPGDAARDFLIEVEDWMARPDPGTLTATDRGDGSLVLHDTRRDATAPRHVLRGAAREAFLYCDEIRGLDRIVAQLARCGGDTRQDAATTEAMLEWMVQQRLMVGEGSLYLSLGLDHPAAATALPMVA